MPDEPNDPERSMSMLSRPNISGVWARRGYGFQDNWLLFQLLEWCQSPDFVGAVNEGVGDVQEVRLTEDSRLDREVRFHQLKSGLVTVPILVAAVETFISMRRSLGASRARFILTSGSTVPELETLPEAIARVRTAVSLYGATSPFSQPTIREFESRVRKLDLGLDAKFIVEHFDFNPEAGWCGNPTLFSLMTRAAMVLLGVPASSIRTVGDRLHCLISLERIGQLISREDVLDVLRSSGATVTAGHRERPWSGAKVVRSTATRIQLFSDQAALLQLSDDSFGVINPGLRSARAITNLLKERAINALEFLVLPSWHSDRAAGMLTLLNSFDVGSVWVHPFFENSRLAQSLGAALTRIPTQFRLVVNEVSIAAGEAGVILFGPDAAAISRGALELKGRPKPNEGIVTLVTSGHKGFLILGDSPTDKLAARLGGRIEAAAGVAVLGAATNSHVRRDFGLILADMETLHQQAETFLVAVESYGVAAGNIEAFANDRFAIRFLRNRWDKPLDLLLTANGLYEHLD